MTFWSAAACRRFSSSHLVAANRRRFEECVRLLAAPPSAEKSAGEKAGASSRTPNTLTEFTRHLHSVTAIEVNRWDQTPGRQAWFQYRDTQLTYEKSYLARLSYVHKNAVHHGLVREPSLYPWCSAGWFQRRAATSLYKTVMGIKVDRVRVADDYEVAPSDV